MTLFPDLAFTPTGAGERQVFHTSLGLFFTTNAPLTVSSLGYWDDNQDGVTEALSVAIFEVNSGTIVNSGGTAAFIEFDGTQGRLFGPTVANQADPDGASGRPGQFRLDNLAAPIVLGPGSYALVTWGFNFFNQMVNAPSSGTAVNINSFGGILTFNDTRYSDQAGVMPTSLDSMNPQYLIGTFSPDQVVIPEPGEYAMAAGSAGLLASWWMRRRAKQRAATAAAATA